MNNVIETTQKNFSSLLPYYFYLKNYFFGFAGDFNFSEIDKINSQN